VAALARAALRALDLGRPQDAPVVVTALGRRRGARPDVMAAATRRLADVLGEPLIERARRAAWLGRDVPGAVDADGRVQADTLDLVFEEAGALIVVRFDDGAAAPAPSPLPTASLARALGRPVREAHVLSLTGP
jgi:hypothetical protein